jgi:AraC-like DNA-binding protein
MAISNPTTPAQYVIILLDLARQRGVATPDLLEGTSLQESSLASIGARVDDNDFTRIIENAYRLTGDRALGLHLGARLNLSAHATVGQAFMTCENLEQVLNFLLKYYRILAPALELKYVQKDGRCWLIPETTDPAVTPEFGHELLFATIVFNLKLLVGNSDIQLRVELPYPEPDYVDEYRTQFGEELFFSARQGSLSFEESWLDAPLPSSNPALLALYEQECQRLLEDLVEQDQLRDQTTQLLRKLEGHYPQMPRVAEMLNMSPRTYRRRLAEEGISFQQLLDNVRTEHATHYLTTTTLPLASIAYIVGFNDVSNFRRAYIKWTGTTPREARDDR